MVTAWLVLVLVLAACCRGDTPDPCSSSPCGTRATCTTFSSGSFICTCDRNGDHPYGKPRHCSQ